MIGQKWWIVPAFAVTLTLAGCKPDEEIRTYTVEKEPERTIPTKAEAAPDGPAKVRFLGAIIPATPRTNWFVRFFGPIDTISPNEDDFNKFLSSIRVNADPAKPLTWTVPPGWTVAPSRQMRVVTLQKGIAELYISDPFPGSLVDNINRWRFESVGLPKVTAAEVPKVTTEIMLGTTKAIRVDFRGPGGKGGMGGPFSGTN